MDNSIEEIKKRVDIVDFIGAYIVLKKTGRNFKAICPFHQEKTPSFVVSPERQIWHCFGACGEGGDIFRFLMKWENITFYEALRDLAQKAGVKLKKITFEDKVWKKKQKLIEINNLAVHYYQYILEKTRFGKKVLDYLKNREINLQISKKFQLGYSPMSWSSLTSFLKIKGYDPEEVENSGLIIKGRKDYYDRFRGRLIFPIKNSRGEVIGFSGRSLENKITEAKYINTPETLLYHKRETLYGIDLAKDAIKKEGSVILVEGEFDMISPFQRGIENIVAIKGSAVTKEQLMLIKRYVNRLNLFLDADQAGEEAIKKAISEIESLDLEAGVITVDFGKDPDEAIRKDLTKFKQVIKKPVPVYDFLLDYFQKKYSINEAFGKKKIGEEMVGYLEKMQNPIVLNHYVKKLAGLLQVSESVVDGLIRKLRYRNKQRISFRVDQQETAGKNRQFTVEKYLLSYIFQNDNPFHTAEKVNQIINLEDFSFTAYQKIWQCLFEFKQKHPEKFDLQKFINTLTPQVLPVFDEVYLVASHDLLMEKKNINRMAYDLKKISLKSQITELLAIQDELVNDKRVKLKELTEQLNQVEKKLVLL